MRLPFIFLLVLPFVACQKDDNNGDACAALEGNWTGISWIEDDEQFFGDTIYIIQSDLEFNPLTDGHGDVVWKLDYTFGGPVTINGSYAVNAACDEVTITPNLGVPSTYHFDIDGNELTLQGEINHVQIEMKYVRD